MCSRQLRHTSKESHQSDRLTVVADKEVENAAPGVMIAGETVDAGAEEEPREQFQQQYLPACQE